MMGRYLMRVMSSAALAAVFLAIGSSRAGAQMFEAVGTRAQGMGGAFVAVADDATASWWNPAGLATGAYFNAVIEKGRVSEPEHPTAAGPAVRTSPGGFAVAFPALGLSYYRVRVSQMHAVATTAGAPEARQDPADAFTRVRSVSVSQFGATVDHSLGDHFVIGSTLKIVRGGVASGSAEGSDDPLDVADDLDTEKTTHTDLDVGAMATWTRVRLGVSVRNLTEPEFGSGADVVRLERQARAGVAITGRQFGPFDALTVDADVDVTTTSSIIGETRHASVGAEV